MMPKALKKVLGKVDPRKQPDPEIVKQFKPGTSRRYINMGVATYQFFYQMAESIDDKELKEYALEIEKAIKAKDDLTQFETYKNLYASRMQELGVWKNIKGLSKYQKLVILNKIRKQAKEH